MGHFPLRFPSIAQELMYLPVILPKIFVKWKVQRKKLKDRTLFLN